MIKVESLRGPSKSSLPMVGGAGRTHIARKPRPQYGFFAKCVGRARGSSRARAACGRPAIAWEGYGETTARLSLIVHKRPTQPGGGQRSRQQPFRHQRALSKKPSDDGASVVLERVASIMIARGTARPPAYDYRLRHGGQCFGYGWRIGVAGLCGPLRGGVERL